MRVLQRVSEDNPREDHSLLKPVPVPSQSSRLRRRSESRPPSAGGRALRRGPTPAQGQKLWLAACPKTFDPACLLRTTPLSTTSRSASPPHPRRRLLSFRHVVALITQTHSPPTVAQNPQHARDRTYSQASPNRPLKQHACPAFCAVPLETTDANQLFARRFTFKPASVYVQLRFIDGDEELVINIREGQSNRCCLLAKHLRRAWPRRFRRVC